MVSVDPSRIIVIEEEPTPNNNVFIKEGCLYVNSKNVRTTVGGKTPPDQIEILFNTLPQIYRQDERIIYSFKSHDELWFIILDFQKINQYIQESNETINKVYLINNDNEFATKPIIEKLCELKDENGNFYVLQYQYDVQDNEIILPESIHIDF